MALLKSYCKVHVDALTGAKTFETIHEEMPPEEENEIKATWALNEARQAIPIKPSADEKVSWLAEGGKELHDKKMQEFQSDYDAKHAVYMQRLDEHQKAFFEYKKMKESKQTT